MPLLHLPSEIRNRIYELALTSSTPLHYREPFSAKITSDPAKPYSFHLLKTLKKPTFLASGRDGPPFEFNQLKYVNKQLHRETAGLELKYSDFEVFRTSSRQVPPGKMLLDFMESMAASRREWLTNKITLRDTCFIEEPDFLTLSVPDTAHTIARVANACRKYPSLSIRYVIPHWTYHEIDADRPYPSFPIGMVYGIFYEFALRGRDITPMLHDPDDPGRAYFSRNSEHEQKAREWLDGMHVDDLQAANLRFWPNAGLRERDAEWWWEHLQPWIERYGAAWKGFALWKLWAEEGL